MFARETLHARGQIDGWPHHGVLAPVATADQAGQPLSAVYANTDGYTRQSGAIEFGVVARQRSADCERRLNRVVALPGVRLQRAEEDEDAVTEEGADAPTMLDDAVADKLEIAVQHVRQGLRIEPFGQRRISGEVGEHGGEHLVFGDAFGAVGKQAFDYTGRREQRAGLLQSLQFDGGGLDIRTHLAQPLPLPRE